MIMPTKAMVTTRFDILGHSWGLGLVHRVGLFACTHLFGIFFSPLMNLGLTDAILLTFSNE